MAYWHNTHNSISDFRLYNERLESHRGHCHGNSHGSVWGFSGGYTGIGLLGGGNFLNSLRTGLGYGLANGLTSLLFIGVGRLLGGLGMGGMLGGGLGMGGMLGGGLYGLGNTWGLRGGNWLDGLFRKKVDVDEDKTKGADDTKGATVEKENADQAALNEIDNEVNGILFNDDKTGLRDLPKNREGLNNLLEKINGLLDRLDKYVKKDEINTAADDRQIELIKARLNTYKGAVEKAIEALPPAEESSKNAPGANESSEDKAVKENNKNEAAKTNNNKNNNDDWKGKEVSEDLQKHLQTLKLNGNDYSKVGDNEKIGRVILAHDASTKTHDVIGASKVSDDKYSSTNFPLTITITDNDNGKSYKYRCIDVVNGYPVYATPNKDSNNNEYILVKDNENNNYKLVQLNINFRGYGEEDTQCKQ